MDEEHSRGTMEAVDESNSELRSFHEHDDARQAMENCNLIVNYLPHDIDDLALKVIHLGVFDYFSLYFLI